MPKRSEPDGPIVVDEPSSLPEGPEVELRVVSGDEMSELERCGLHASIVRGVRDGLAGRELELDVFLDQIHAEA